MNKKPIVFFDLETTGINQQSDRIVEMFALRVNPDGSQDEFYSRFNPYPVEVGAEAEKVHGISSNDLLGEPLFSEKADEVIAFFEGCDIGGYNILHFDIPMLFEELYRSNRIHDFKKHQIIDVFKIWTVSEPRTLTGAVKRFLGESHDHAHEAKADVFATARIYDQQKEIYQHMYESIDAMIEASNPEMRANLDFSGKFQTTEDGSVIVTFGKHKNKTIQTVYKEDPEYFRWIFEKSEMPTDTRIIARKIYARLQENKS